MEEILAVVIKLGKLQVSTSVYVTFVLIVPTMEHAAMEATVSKLNKVKNAMNEVWGFDQELMGVTSKGDDDWTNHYLAQEMDTSVSLYYKYTVDDTQISRLKDKLDMLVVVLVTPISSEQKIISPYMEVTVCYKE